MGSCINGEEKNLLEKFRGEPKMEHEIGGLLDLRLSSMDMYIDQSKKELDLTGHLRGGPEKPKVMEAPNNRLAKKLEERKYFPCKYCKKKFSNSQALGGHQNAHRRERAWMRKDKRLDMAPYGHMDGYSYLLPMAPSPSHYNHGRSLGVNMQYSSMIHKQPPHGFFHRLGSTNGGLEGWRRPSAFMNQNALHDNYWTSTGAFPPQDTMGLINRRASFDTFSGSGFLANQNIAATRIYSDDHVGLAGDDLSLNL